MNALTQAAILNNVGNSFMTAGNVSASIDAFQNALDTLQEGAKTGAFPLPQSSTPTRRLDRLSRWVKQCPQNVHTSQTSNSYVYGRPFLIEAERTPSSDEEYVACVGFVGCHILFNCALAYHIQADEIGCQVSARHASDLYQTLLELVHFRRSTLDAGDNTYAAITCLAFNNVAHLHYEQCRYQECATCMDAMLFMVHDIGCIEEYFLPEELAGLLLNAEYARIPAAAGAA
jgi:hypothetical protein